MEEKERYRLLAVKLQEDMRREAEAIEGYQKDLNDLKEFSDPDALAISAQIEEFIQDELNHQKGLMRLYIMITGIEPKED
ncbi:MAG: hypothetical protein RR839_00530 [Oscillospiraceae bacterium]